MEYALFGIAIKQIVIGYPGGTFSFQPFRKNLNRVPHLNSRSILIHPAPELHDTAGAVHGNRRRACFLDITQLALQNRR